MNEELRRGIPNPIKTGTVEISEEERHELLVRMCEKLHLDITQAKPINNENHEKH